MQRDVKSLSDFFDDEEEEQESPSWRPKTIREAKLDEEMEGDAEQFEKCNNFIEWELYIAQKYYGRTHIGYPCDDAQDIKQEQGASDEYFQHIKSCSECKRLLNKLEEKCKM